MNKEHHMICPHCGKELSTTTFINPMQHVQGCQPIQGVFVLNANAAAANALPVTNLNHMAVNGCNPIPQITFLKF